MFVFFCDMAHAQFDSAQNWRYQPEANALYNTTVPTLNGNAIGRQHRYVAAVRCFGNDMPDPGIKISITTFDASGDPAPIAFRYRSNQPTYRYIHTKMRIGNTQPGNALWVRDGYSNQAALEITQGSEYTGVVTEGHFKPAESLYNEIKNAAAANEKLVVSDLFVDDPFVINVGGPAWDRFIAQCPILTANESTDHVDNRLNTTTTDPQSTLSEDHSLDNSLQASLNALEKTYARTVETERGNWQDTQQLRRLNQKSERWLASRCNSDLCRKRWYATRIALLKRDHLSSDPSFDCDFATSLSEMLICNNEQLAKRDRELSSLYKRAKSITNNAPAFREQTLAEWKRRERDCTDRACLRDWYDLRETQLQAWLTGAAS